MKEGRAKGLRDKVDGHVYLDVLKYKPPPQISALLLIKEVYVMTWWSLPSISSPAAKLFFPLTCVQSQEKIEEHRPEGRE